ncbi:MAG: hypothetical protein HONBIEJF_00996 [Fimbriimonadaceae bacterium]|nr:hypothetical protein [Fimbriimonadaceae bacterium]
MFHRNRPLTGTATRLTALCCALSFITTAVRADYYVSTGLETGPSTIYRFADDGTPKGSFGTDVLGLAIGIAFASDDVLLVCDYFNGVRAIHADGTDLGSFATEADTNSIIVDSYGNVLVSDYYGGRIRRYSALGAYLGVFAVTGLSRHGQLAMDGDGNIYISSFYPGEQTIYRYDRDGNYLGVFADYGSSGILSPTGLAFKGDGSLLVSNTFHNTIDHLDSAGGWIGTFAATGMWEPEWLTVEPNGDVLLPSWSGGYVERYDSVGNDLGAFIVLPHCYQILSGPDIVSANGLTVHRGKVTGGSVGSLTETDGSVLRLTKTVVASGDPEAPIVFDLRTTATTLTPSGLSVAVTGRMAEAGSFTQELALLDKSGNESSVVRTDAIDTNNLVARLAVSGDPADYVAADGTVAVRVTVRSSGPIVGKSWSYECDRAVWTVRK